MHLERIERYSSALSMRRVCSILTLVALLCPMALPLWASTMDMTQPASCHRMPMHSETASQTAAHHCHDMAGAGGSSSADQGDGATLTVSSHPEKCPMNCCSQAAPPSAAALHNSSFLPMPATVEARPHFAPVMFARAGFSSHTDRGPPTL